jgi:hypothetical protein
MIRNKIGRTLFGIGLLLLLILPVGLSLKANSAYLISEETLTDLGYETVLHTTKGTLNNNPQEIDFVNFNPKTNRTVRLIPWAVLNKETETNTRSTVLQIAQDYELKNPESKVIAGINGDFFPFVSLNENPLSSQVIDGDVHQASVFNQNYNGVNYPANALGIMGDGSLKTSHIIGASSQLYLDVFDGSGEVITSEPVSLNKAPGAGETSVYFGSNYSTPINFAKGIYYVSNPFFMRTGSYFGRGVISSKETSVTLGRKTFAIVSNKQALTDSLSIGTQIRITKRVTGDLAGAESVIGFYGYPLRSGTIPAYGAYPVGLGGSKTQSTWTAANPRTFLGIKADGSVMMGLVKGRAAGKTGLTGQGVGALLKDFDCLEGFMFDGGGSSTLVSRINGLLQTASLGTSETRAVVNALLLVEDEMAPVILNQRIDNVGPDTISMSIHPVVDASITLTKVFATINGTSHELTDNQFTLENASPNTTYNISFKAEYTKDGTPGVYQSSLVLTVTTSTLAPEIVIDEIVPGTTTMSFKVTLKDYGSEITEAYFALNGEKKVMNKGTNEFEFTNLTPGVSNSYSAIVKYFDSKTVKYTFYTFPATTILTLEEEAAKTGCRSQAASFMGFLSIMAMAVFILRRKH